MTDRAVSIVAHMVTRERTTTSTQHTQTPMFKGAIELAIKHSVTLGRDHNGNYYVRRDRVIVDTTRSARPTVANVKALIRRNVARS